jgi:hypothetical protein
MSETRKKPPIGHMACPECDHDHAEVLLDKNGKPYRYCPNCNAQYFSRDAARAKNLLAKMRPAPNAAAAFPDPQSAVAPDPSTPTAAPKTRRVGILLDG